MKKIPQHIREHLEAIQKWMLIPLPKTVKVMSGISMPKNIKLNDIPICGNCEFFLKFPPSELETALVNEKGICRFFPKQEEKEIWHWCGQWKESE